MDLYEAIHSRRTIHNYEAEPVEDAVLNRILGAAHMAPCHKLTWPWRFNVVGPSTREAVVEIGIRLKGGADPSERLVNAIRSKVLNPGALVVVSQVIDDDAHRRQEDYAATCCAVQNLQLAACAEGLGTKWSTGALTQDPSLYTLLDINPGTEQIIGFVWVGHASNTPSISRPPVEELIRRHS